MMWSVFLKLLLTLKSIKLVISGSVEAAENYIQSFSKAADVQMHDLFKEEAGASFKEELKTYIKLVLFSLTLFQ